ncbi:MAG TPA: hypothetical protein DEP48_04635 [Persephonella sp.]|uniref:Uncharacterized protein n=1 Tax=Persephonella marina (strain DSM 14350 / EX-H1) TaxID=123214 RepID=C0QQ15_PERMH|nr:MULTISPECIES: hypothetical protein [Persephonella]ACO04884.1 hypothetical protein PERMA_0975 [Persephonella marina EX-H1]HCB69624.1 hypothetical protein [Persephonella sp.]
MSLITVEISDGKVKGAVLKRYNSFVEIVDYNINRTGRYYISVFYQDFIHSKIVIPPVRDENTLSFLIKNKLSDKLESGVNYIFLPVKNREVSENQVEYDVYAVPEKLFFEAVERLNIKDLTSIEVFTLSQFALSGITSKISGDETVFMTYTDEEKFIVTVSQNGKILYTRSTKIPEFVNDEQQLINFYYENFNLTYIYVAQNQGIDIDVIGLVGEISKNEQFVELIHTFSNKPVYTVLPELFVKKGSFEQFNSYVIQIGSLNIKDTYNFLPVDVKHKKIFSGASKKLSYLLVLVLLIFSFLNLNKFMDLKERFFRLKNSYYSLKQTFQREVLSKELTYDQIVYLVRYINLLSPERKTIYILNRLSGILSVIRDENINITYSEGKRYITIRSDQKFKSVKEIEDFKRKLKNELDKLNDFKIRDRSVYNIDNLTGKIFLEIVKER